MDPFVAVIMAGGRGQRFWPLSTEARPKQFLDLSRSGRTLIQETFDRVCPLAGGAGRVYIATGERYLELVREQLPEVPEENLIVEPVGRDSAPAIALAALTIHERTGGAVTGFFSSDHRIANAAAFQRTVRRAEGVAREQRGLVTIGITPDRPATGYGYIEQGEALPDPGDDEGGVPAFQVARFVEKPDAATAERYLDSGRYLWNAGIFVWRSDVILAELERHTPDLLRPLRGALREDRVAEVFPALQKISIDYAVMEHTDAACVVPGAFGWDDIGDWVALERLLERRPDDVNTVVGRHVGLDARDNIIYTEEDDDLVVTLGVENLVVAKRGNTLLLVHRDRVQDIKKLLADERLAKAVREE